MTQQPGWYDDPQDPSSLRYFDGILWTDNVVPKASPSAAASSIGRPVDPYAAAQPSPASPWGAPGASGGDSGGTPPAGPSAVRDAGPHYANPGQVPYGAPPSGYGYGAAPQLGWRPAGPSTPEGAPLAEWWQRLLAYLLDALLSGLLVGAATVYWWLPFLQSYVDLIRTVINSPSGQLDPRAVEALTDQLTGSVVPITLVQVLVVLVYQVFFLTRSGATPGKMALGIRVRRAGRPGPLTVVEALRREALRVGFGLLGMVPLISIVSGLLSLLDPMWLLWDPRRQALHDKVADTLVEVKPKPLR